jgi:hypothetical protein
MIGRRLKPAAPKTKQTMTGIFIAYNQAYYDEITELLAQNGAHGFTEWDEIKGHGTKTGEPHLGNHAWPTLNNAILTIVEDNLADPILKQLDSKNKKLQNLD